MQSYRELSALYLANHPLVEDERLPVVNSTSLPFSTFTAWYWPEGESDFVQPTNEELAVAVLYNNFKIRQCGFFERYLDQMRNNAPVDIDGSTATRLFTKHKTKGWQYSVETWVHAAKPSFNDETRFNNIVDIIDYSERAWPEAWDRFKSNHPAIFGK